MGFLLIVMGTLEIETKRDRQREGREKRVGERRD